MGNTMKRSRSCSGCLPARECTKERSNEPCNADAYVDEHVQAVHGLRCAQGKAELEDDDQIDCNQRDANAGHEQICGTSRWRESNFRAIPRIQAPTCVYSHAVVLAAAFESHKGGTNDAKDTG